MIRYAKWSHLSMFHYARTKGNLMKKKSMYVKLIKGLFKPNSAAKFTDRINLSH